MNKGTCVFSGVTACCQVSLLDTEVRMWSLAAAESVASVKTGHVEHQSVRFEFNKVCRHGCEKTTEFFLQEDI